MELFMLILLVAALVAVTVAYVLKGRLESAEAALQRSEESLRELHGRADAEAHEARRVLQETKAVHERELQALAPFRAIRDAAAALKLTQQRADELLKAAGQQHASILNAAQEQAAIELRTAREAAERMRKEASAEVAAGRKQHREQMQARAAEADAKMAEAMAQADRIIEDARRRAEQIAGDAYLAKEQSAALTKAAKAMANVIDGYGDRYILPTYGLLDELAAQYAFDDAGKELKLARERSRMLVESGRAATCDYVEEERRKAAIHFVIDAFNGKVDSILTGVKSTNHGTLRQKISDAGALVNHLGKAFREAKIMEAYLDARQLELKWACAVQALKEREREEQRVIREQMREEERAQREFERAQREAERDEQVLRKAMEKAEQQLEKATEEQKIRFEAQLAELRGKLVEAELKNQRALSMAQQTKVGHVYVISNIGSFGENVLKIGMTRRLEPVERVMELGDASVPFPFDIHAMIYSEDAPQLERDLHQLFLDRQINKVNPRKEFFRMAIAEIKAAVDQRGLKATWTLLAAAAQYRESLEIEKQITESTAARIEWEAAQRKIDPVMMEPRSGEQSIAA